MQITDHGHVGHNKPILETPYLKWISSYTFLEKVTIANKREASRGFCLLLGAKHVYSCGEPGLQRFTTVIRKGFCFFVCCTYSSFPGSYALYTYTLCCFCSFPFLCRCFSLNCDPTPDVSHLYHHIQAPQPSFSFWMQSLNRKIINHDQ